MKLASVRELKEELKQKPQLPRVYAAAFATPRAMTAALDETHTRSPRHNLVSLGVAAGGSGRHFRLGIRIHVAERAKALAMAQELTRAARGECDLRIVPRVAKRVSPSPEWFAKRRRPLEAGISIGHFRITAGTLGFFVGDDDGVYILSNNHVLADVNRGQPGDPILQPGPYDERRARGRKLRQEDVVGVLDRFVPISFSRSNVVDCAIAEIFKDVERVDGRTRAIRKRVKGTKPVTVDDLHLPVFKAGRTTGITRGRITQVEVDRLRVDMGDGSRQRTALFSDQFEVEGPSPRRRFSAAGDSGSLIVDAQGFARGLLFAGGPDSRGNDLTYAGQIEVVLKKLGVTLVV
jgi:hypothetical protein